MNLPVLLSLSVLLNILLIVILVTPLGHGTLISIISKQRKVYRELKKENKKLEERNENLLMDRFPLDEPLSVNLKSHFTDDEIMQNDNRLEVGVWDGK
jgi:hypothetical protein